MAIERKPRVLVCGGMAAVRATLAARLRSVAADALDDQDYALALATGAASADVAVVVADAGPELSGDTRRHLALAALLEIGHVVVALADPAAEAGVRAFAAGIGLGDLVCLPLAGDALPGHLAKLETASPVGAPPVAADQFEATLAWLGAQPLLPGRSYAIRIGAEIVATVSAALKYRINLDTLEHVAAKTLEPHDIGVCNLNLDRAVPCWPDAECRAHGAFVIIDRHSGATVGAGRLNFALRRAHNLHWQAIQVDKPARSALKGHKPGVLWFTGLSGSGKSTIANLVERQLHALGRHTYLLDGDNVRHGLNKDLGFTEADRVENIRRIAEVARLMVDAGLIVLVAFISPFRAERRLARSLVQGGEFFEVFVDTPLDVAEQRDPKGLYRKARRGELKNFTGIDSPYENPEHPEIRLDTTVLSAGQAATQVIARLTAAGLLAAG